MQNVRRFRKDTFLITSNKLRMKWAREVMKIEKITYHQHPMIERVIFYHPFFIDRNWQ